MQARTPLRDDAGTVASRFARALAALEEFHDADPTLDVAATPGWSVGEVLAHLAIESDRYARELEGHGNWSTTAADIPETNRVELENFRNRDPHQLVEAIRRNVDRYLGSLHRRDLDDIAHRLDGGLVVPLRAGAGVLLGELTVHAADLAATLGLHHSIPRADAAFVIDGVWRVLPAFLDHRKAAGVQASIEVRLRGHQTLRMRIEDGAVTLGTLGPRSDAVVSADPATFLLTMYGRRSQLSGILRLRTIAFGRRPHRAFLLRRLFISP